MYDIPPAPGARFRIQRAFSLNSSPETPPPSSIDQTLSIQPTPPPRPQRSHTWLNSSTEVTLSYMRPAVHRPVVPQRILPQGNLSYKTWDGRPDNHLRSLSLAECGAYSVPPLRSAPPVYSTGTVAGLRRERALSEQGPGKCFSTIIHSHFMNFCDVFFYFFNLWVFLEFVIIIIITSKYNLSLC